MATMLSKTSGDVKEVVTITITDEGVVEQTRTRVSKRGLSRKAAFPPSSYAPMTAAEKVTELVESLVAQGFTLDDHGDLDFQSYSFAIELANPPTQDLQAVLASLGTSLQTDPITNLETVRGTSFVVTTIGSTKRLNAAVNACPAPTSQTVLLYHIVLAACLHPDAKCFDTEGGAVDLQQRIEDANRAGLVTDQQLEALYVARRLRRPVHIPPNPLPGAFLATF